MLNQALTKAGYSPRKTMKYLAEQGLISAYADKNGKKTYSVMRRFGNRSSRFVEFFLGNLSENKDPIDDMDEMDESEVPAGWQQDKQTSISEFTELDSNDKELPF